MIRIVALTEAGKKLAERLCLSLPDAILSYKPQPFAEEVQKAFLAGERLIFICATGIVVRTLAPVLQNKHLDPAVLVMDEAGQYVIPLLSGHEGGANEWARQVAEASEAEVVITTANPYLKPVYAVGMGCERDCPVESLQDILQYSLEKAGLTLDQIDSINSIDIKADEVGLIELAKRLNKPYRTWSVPQLMQVKDKLSTHSDYVYDTVGVYGVAESAALVGVKSGVNIGVKDAMGTEPELVLVKQKNAKATCAIARAYPKLNA